MKTRLCLIALCLLGLSSAQAFDFLYVEDGFEMTRIARVDPLNANGTGTLVLAHDECADCATRFTYSSETYLQTATGQRRPIQELRNWTGYTAEVVYRLPDEQVVRIRIFPPQPGSSEE